MKSQDELKSLHSNDYVEMYEKKPISRLSRLLKHIDFSKSHKVIDCACGNGMLMNLIAPKVDSYEGIDFSEDFTEAANKRLHNSKIQNASFHCQDINVFLTTRADKYDAAFALDFSEHVYDNEWVKILKSIHYSLKKNGKLYIHTPNAEFFIEIMKENNFILKQFPEHIAVRNLNNNIKLLNKAGFTLITCKKIPHYNILKALHVFSYLPYVGKYFKARLFIEATK